MRKGIKTPSQKDLPPKKMKDGSEIKKKASQHSTNINSLHDNCLKGIFSHFNLSERLEYEKVCHRWKKILQILWDSQQELTSEDLYLVRIPDLPRHQHVLAQCEGSINGESIISKYRSFYMIIRRCGKSLKLLDVTDFCPNFAALLISKYCPNLETIKISSHLTLYSVGIIENTLNSLQNLSVLGRRHSEDELKIKSLFVNCKSLETLELKHCYLYFGVNVFKTWATSLKVVRLYECRVKIAFLIPENSEVTELYFCNHFIEPGDLIRISSLTPNLEVLRLEDKRYGFKIDEKEYFNLSKLYKLSTLEIIPSFYVTDDVLQMFTKSFTKLRILDISNHLGFVGGIRERFTSEGLLKINKFSFLEELDISYLKYVNNNILERLSGKPTCKTLIILKCRSCADVRDQGCVSIISNCKLLEIFDISGCVNVTKYTVDTAISISETQRKVPLRLFVAGTKVDKNEVKSTSKLLVLKF